MSECIDVNINNILICGCGNGMHALLPMAIENFGCRVKVYTPFADEADRLNETLHRTGGIRTCGCSQSPRCSPFLATADAQRAALDTDMVLMVLPAFAHGDVLRQLAPYLHDGIIVGAMPARSGLEFQACRILTDVNLGSFTVFGLQTLPWACRLKTFGSEVEVLGIKQSVGLSAVPAMLTEALSDFMTQLLDVPIYPMNSMLALSLSNMGQIIHPGIMFGLFRDYRQETYSAAEVPLFYGGVDEKTADVLQQLSDEVQQIKTALQQGLGPGIDFSKVLPIEDWLLRSYSDMVEDHGSLAQAFRSNRAYRGLKVPVRKIGQDRYVPEFKSRYLTEDLPTGLLFTAGLARVSEIAVPTIDTVIQTTQSWVEKEYLRNGDLTGSNIGETRIPQNYGIENMADLKTMIHQEFYTL